MMPDGSAEAEAEAEAGMRGLADETGLPVLASIPWDPRLASTTDRGVPQVLADPGSPSARRLSELAERVVQLRASAP
jgi:MinD-like ATPase involved in chromosome partitioning or flagellar assembly